MVESKIVKPIGNLDVPFKQKADGTLYTFDPAISPAQGTTTAIGTNVTLIDNLRTEATNHWNGQLLLITSGVNIGQVREVVTWNLPAFTFTVSPAFEVPVVAGITYQVLSALAADIETAALQANLGTIADVEAEAGTALARLLWNKGGIRRGTGTILPVNTSLYDWILTRATPADVEALVENAVDAGNLTHDITTVNDLTETQMVEIAKAGIYALSVFVDLDVLETAVEGGTIKIRLYNKIDGAAYSDKPSAYVEYTVGSENEYPSIEVDMVHGYCKLTIICSTDVTVTRTIAYRYIVRDLGA